MEYLFNRCIPKPTTNRCTRSLISATTSGSYLAKKLNYMIYSWTLILPCSNRKNLSCLSRWSSTGIYCCKIASKNSFHPAAWAIIPLDYSHDSYHIMAIFFSLYEACFKHLVSVACITRKVLCSWSKKFWRSSFGSILVNIGGSKFMNSQTLVLVALFEMAGAWCWACKAINRVNNCTALLISKSWSISIGGGIKGILTSLYCSEGGGVVSNT